MYAYRTYNHGGNQEKLPPGSDFIRRFVVYTFLFGLQLIRS